MFIQCSGWVANIREALHQGWISFLMPEVWIRIELVQAKSISLKHRDTTVTNKKIYSLIDYGFTLQTTLKCNSDTFF